MSKDEEKPYPWKESTERDLEDFLKENPHFLDVQDGEHKSKRAEVDDVMKSFPKSLQKNFTWMPHELDDRNEEAVDDFFGKNLLSSSNDSSNEEVSRSS